MVGRIVGHHHDAGDARHGVGMRLERRIPEVFGKMLLTGEEAGVGRARISRERKRERDLDGATVGAPALTFEVEHVEVVDAGGAVPVCRRNAAGSITWISPRGVSIVMPDDVAWMSRTPAKAERKM